jgi:hypothetical protein
MTTAHARALSRLAGALLGAIMLLAAGCSVGGGSSPQTDPAGTAHDAVAVSSSGRAFADRTAGPIRGRRGSGSRIAWAPSLPRCSYAAGTPGPAPTGAASGRQARISRVGAADLGGRAGFSRPAPAPCVRSAPVPAICPRNPHLMLPCRKT